MDTLVRRSFLAVFIVAIMTVCLHALEVDVDEIRAKKVKFINYQYSNKKPTPPQDIRAIGRGLADEAKKRPFNELVRFKMKYSIIRAISEKEPEKLAADIFVIEKTAQVGHIDAIRLIIETYLERMYAYPKKDAKTLALYASYYNAVHRGDMGYFSKKYKTSVTSNINKGNAGIALRWNQWPGTTRMLIPLTKDRKRDKIDLDTISDDDTTDVIRKDETNIDDRKKMNEMKEDKLKDDREKLDRDKKKLEDDKKKREDEKREDRKKKEELDRKKDEQKRRQNDLDRKKEETKKITDEDKRKKQEEENRKKQEEIDRDKKRLTDDEDKLKKKEKEDSEKDKDLRKKEDDLKKEEKKQDERKKKYSEERKEIRKDESKGGGKKETTPKKDDSIKRDEKKKDEKIDKTIAADKFFYLKINEYLQDGHYNNDLFLIDAANRKVLFKSPVQHITGHEYDMLGGDVVVITHQGDRTARHRLTLVDGNTLLAKVNGTDDVFWRSFVEVYEGSVYAVLKDNNAYYLGKFDAQMKLIAKSNVKVNEETFIRFYRDFIYINRSDKKIVVLKKNDLTFDGEVKP